MKWIEESRTLELTARNVNALTAKLGDPASARMLQSDDGIATVHAVETAEPVSVTAAAAEGVVVLSRVQLIILAVAGGTVDVAGITVKAVPDSEHYSNRPSGPVVLPSSAEAHGPETGHWRLRHICEVCGRDEVLTPTAAFEAGWDYPPQVGKFGVVGPRKCGDCGIEATVWAALVMNGVAIEDLTDAQRDVVARILSEPMSIEVEP